VAGVETIQAAPDIVPAAQYDSSSSGRFFFFFFRFSSSTQMLLLPWSGGVEGWKNARSYR
jgi:hypothetical protein